MQRARRIFRPASTLMCNLTVGLALTACSPADQPPADGRTADANAASSERPDSPRPDAVLTPANRDAAAMTEDAARDASLAAQEAGPASSPDAATHADADRGDTNGQPDPQNPLVGVGPVKTLTDIGAPGEATHWIGALGKVTVGQRAGADSVLFLVDPATGAKTPLRRGSGETVGVAQDRDGHLLYAEQLASSRRISRSKAPAGMPGFEELTPFLTEFPGGTLGGRAGERQVPQGRFNRPNDLVLHRRTGAIYFTDPYFSGTGPEYPLGREHQGVFRASADGKTIVAEALLHDKPNGIELSPDQRTLYVATRGPDVIHKFPVNEDGSLGPRATFVMIGAGQSMYADGMAVDVQGNVYGCTDGGGIQVWSPTGKRYGMLPGTGGAKNATFGGSEGKTLFFVAGSQLKRIDVRVAGLP